ncbi:MAG TPA: hypothetical protein VJQ25_11750 [Nitrospira sp.]|nr:hypothetical protein [Nitrospira sp.]
MSEFRDPAEVVPHEQYIDRLKEAGELSDEEADRVSEELREFELAEPESKADRIIRQCKQNGEPYFVLRGKDIFSVGAINYYALQAERHGPMDLAFQESLKQVVQMFRDWQGSHVNLTRYPD